MFHHPNSALCVTLPSMNIKRILAGATVLTVLGSVSLVVVGALPARAAATPTFVQGTGRHAPRTTALAVTPAFNVTTGDRFIVEVGVWNSAGATASRVSDSAGNGYVELLHYKASDKTEL